MNYIYSKHAESQIENRSLKKGLIDKAIHEPDTVLKYDECLTVFQKVFLNKSKKLYLYRAFINTSKEPALVVTVYKTSKITKYENKI